jgi:hypothetical protein
MEHKLKILTKEVVEDNLIFDGPILSAAVVALLSLR